VVHARRAEAGAVQGHPDELAEVVDGPVDAVAEPEGPDLGRDDGGPPHVHGHRVRVVEEQGVGAQLPHVGEERAEQREGAEGAEDAADPGRVADGLQEAVLGGDLEVEAGGGDAADLHHVDHEVGAGQGRAPVEGGGERDRGTEPLGDLPRGALGDGQPLLVDVVEAQIEIAQLGEADEVGEELTGEHDAPGADERDGGHGSDPVRTGRASSTTVAVPARSAQSF
jgi:hypothetical protein